MLINSRVAFGEIVTEQFTVDQIKNEPMLFNCDLQSTRRLGGPLTHSFLAALPPDICSKPDLIIDSRVHMLMPGWFPAIPGYHHDDVPRSREDGQPNYKTPEYRSNHAMMLVNADICPTEFAIGEADFQIPEQGETIYKYWHNDVIKYLEMGKLQIVEAADKTVLFFNDRTWHQATHARKNGWRWFIRASWNTHRKPTNELRRQVQVYLENPMEGW